MTKFLFSGWLLALLFCLPALAQEVTVSGRVTSSDDGSALPGVSVQVKGTTRGTSTDASGNYRINVPGDAQLVFSFIGFANQEVAVGNQTTINVAMQASNNALEEVVVVGYGTQKRASLTGAIANIQGRELVNVPMANLGNQLQGQVAGAQITNQNGRPGAPAFIRIRGVGSLNAGSDPLYVVDGIPVTADAYQAIPTTAIEQISVLKDASSVSIYGSRGSNGVILVTTRKPSPTEGPRVEVNLRYGISEKTPDNFELMSSQQKLQYEYDLGYANSYVADYLRTRNIANITSARPADLQPIWDQLNAQSVNWLDVLLRQGKQHTETINLSGGSEKLSYFLGLQNYGEQGINNGSDYRRQIGTLNLEFRPYKWLRAGQTVNFSYRKENLLRDRNNAQSPFRAMYTYNPYEPEFNPDGSYNLTHQGFSISEAIANNTENSRTINGLATGYVGITPIENLDIRSTIGLNYIDVAREYYIKPGSILDQYVGDPNAPGNKTDNGSTTFNYIWTNTAQYNFTLAGRNNFRLLGGTEFTKNSFKSYLLTSKGFPSGNVSTQDNASTPLQTTSGKSDWALYSLFARLNYDFDQKYLLEASVRRDGSSRFGANNRYGTFWALGLGWNLKREAFMKDVTFIDNLKIRAAVGTAGNFNIGNYQSLGLYGYGSYGTSSSAVPTQLANPDLTWERSQSTNLGLEFDLFNQRLRGVVEVYNRDTKDLLLFVPLSNVTGFSSRLENVGTMNNRGIEADLAYDLVRTKDVRWTLRGNITLNRNRITALYNNAEIPNGLSRYVVGQPIDVYFLNRWAGVNPANGDAQYLNKNGEVTNAFSSGDAVTLNGKSPDPRYYGSIFNTVSYKGLALSAQLYYSGGNYIYNNIWQTLVSDGANRASQQAVFALDYWKQAGDNSPNPRATGVSRTTDRFLQKGDFIRLRNVTLSYTLPTNLLNRIGMGRATTAGSQYGGVSFFVQGQNLFYRAAEYKGDPEVGIGSAEGNANALRGGLISIFSYPTVRSYTAGLNIAF